MIQLYIVRHGETEENAAGILQGHIEGHLSDRGILQTQELKEKISTDLHPDRIISSDLRRTIDTAKILNENYHLELETSALLRERDWGEYTGRKIAELPKGAFPASVESITHMMNRAGEFLHTLAEECIRQPQVHSVLIVSHGVFSRCLLAAATERSIHDIPILKNLEIREVELSPDFTYHPHPSDTTTARLSEDNTSSLSHGKEC